MLVGREAERAAIDRVVAGARVGQSGVLVLTGEAGIGKTALMEHAAAAATGMRVLRAVGSGAEREVTFGGLLQLLRPALDLLDRIPAPQGEALAAALALREGAPGDRFAIGAATLSLMTRYAEDQPTLVLLDDVHGLDQPSVEAVAFVARRLLTDGIAVLAATRPEAEPPALTDLPHLPLSGLALDHASALLAGAGVARASGPALARLHGATGGNPLALLELADEVDEILRLPPAVPVPVPDVLADSFTRRVAQLPTSTRAALLLATVAEGDLAVVTAAAPALGTSLEALDAAQDAGLLTVSGGRATFRHPITRSSAYAAAPAAARRRAHRAVADALPAADLERRTWHLAEAAVGFDQELAEALETVAQRARNRSAYAVAATALERAALRTEEPDRRASRLLAGAEAAWLAGQGERVLAMLEESAELSPDPRHRAAVDGLRGSLLAHSGSLAEARDLLLRAARTMGTTDPNLAARLLADAAEACLWMGDVDGGLDVARLVDDLPWEPLDAQARVLAGLAAGMGQVLAGGRGIERIRAAVEVLAASTEPQVDPRRPATTITGVLFLREHATGRQLVRDSVRDLRVRGAVASLPGLLVQQARDEATTDRWHDAVAHYEECATLAREVGHTTELTLARAGLSVVLARMGSGAACEAAASEALALADRHQVHLARVWAEYARGELALTLGEPAEALRRYHQLEEVLAGLRLSDVDLDPGPEVVETLIRRSEPGPARAAAERYHAAAVAKGQPWAQARASRAMALVSAGEEATSLFEAALRLHDEASDAYEAARTRLLYGSALRRQRRRVDSRGVLRAAVETFERLGARPWADAAARELAATGEPPRRSADPVLSQLTAQELQVCRMLVDGRTTREAAAALFLSPKTVEYHLRKVYIKLDLHTRAELTAALARAGLQP